MAENASGPFAPSFSPPYGASREGGQGGSGPANRESSPKDGRRRSRAHRQQTHSRRRSPPTPPRPLCGQGGESSRRGGESPQRVVAIARSWLGTPYLHQASVKGQGTDCLGLIRGVWRELHGAEPEIAPPYTPDWNERGFARGEEPLLEAARRWLVEIREPGTGNREPETHVAVPSPDSDRPSVYGRPTPVHGSRFPVLHPRPGDILIFRIVAAGPAKHCGILTEADRFIHAYAGRCVLESWYARWWRERTAGVFAFPAATGNREPCGRPSNE